MLPPFTACTVAPLVRPRFDYCNLPKHQLDRLLGIEDTLARIFVCASKFSHVTFGLKCFTGSKFDNALIIKSALSLSKHLTLLNLFTFETSFIFNLENPHSSSCFTIACPHCTARVKATNRSFRQVARLNGMSSLFHCIFYLGLHLPCPVLLSDYSLQSQTLHFIPSSCPIFRSYPNLHCSAILPPD